MNKYITEQEARAIFKEEMRKMVGYSELQIPEYLPTSEAYLKLNYPSAASLRKAAHDGFFRAGIEFQDRRTKDSTYHNYYFNINACVKRLNTPAEKRRA